MTAPGPPPAPVRETLREGLSRGPAAHDRVSPASSVPPSCPGCSRAGPTPTRSAWCSRSTRCSPARRVKELEITDPHTAGRIRLVEGDITAGGLGLSPRERTRLDDVQEVWHLAAVYDLAVPAAIARRVNVGGTANVLAFCAEQPGLRRLQYVSTCYVSGRFEGALHRGLPRGGPGLPQPLRGDEVRGRAARAQGRSATACPPRSTARASSSATRQTGATQKYDGPYFLATFLARQASVAVVPAVGDADTVRVCLVPRDFVVGAMDELSVLEESEGRTYALVDPDPPTVREVVTTFAAHRRAKVVWLPLPLRPVHALVEHVPGMERLLGPARRGARLLRLAHDVPDDEHDGRPHGIRPDLPAVRLLRRPPPHLHGGSTPSTTPTR